MLWWGQCLKGCRKNTDPNKRINVVYLPQKFGMECSPLITALSKWRDCPDACWRQASFIYLSHGGRIKEIRFSFINRLNQHKKSLLIPTVLEKGRIKLNKGHEIIFFGNSPVFNHQFYQSCNRSCELFFNDTYESPINQTEKEILKLPKTRKIISSACIHK